MFSDFVRLMPEDTFKFKCKNCGDCCRNVKRTVMLESLDLFRLARYLNLDVSDTALKCAETATLAWGMPILVMKTKPVNDVCCFLKSGKCGIQQVKPRTCRLYPLSAGPDGDLKNLIILKSRERAFHCTGEEHKAGEWLSDNMDDESRSFILTEYRLLHNLGKIARQIPRSNENRVNELMIIYRYLLFDTDMEFMPQYERNMAKLEELLSELIKNN